MASSGDMTWEQAQKFFDTNDPPITGDSKDYYILVDAAFRCRNLPGLSCEIGLRGGGGSGYIMKAFAVSDQGFRTHIAIDPFGNIEYESHDGVMERLDYNNAMRSLTMQALYKLAYNLNMNFLFFPLEDTEFFKRFKDGVPIYEEFKRLENQYCLVHFDGPHARKILEKEVKFFVERAVPKAVFVFDDVQYYDHASLHSEVLAPNNLRLHLYTGIKASYVYCPNGEDIDD